MTRLRYIALGAAILASGCSGRTPDDAVFGVWTPVSINDCENVIMAIEHDLFGMGAFQTSFLLGDTERIERPEPGIVDVVYRPTIQHEDGRPAGFSPITGAVRFEELGPDRLRGIGEFRPGSRELEPLQAEHRPLMDVRRCPNAPPPQT